MSDPATIRNLRSSALVGAAVVGASLTLGATLLVGAVADRWVEQTRSGLEVSAVRGVRALAVAAGSGLAAADRERIDRAFAALGLGDEVVAQVAERPGRWAANLGTAPWPTAELFSGPPGVVSDRPLHLVAWLPAPPNGIPVGRVAVVVSKRALARAEVLARWARIGTLFGGSGMVLAVLVGFAAFGRVALRGAERAAQEVETLARDRARQAAEIEALVEARRRILDHVGEGYLTIGLDGRLEAEKSATVSGWFERADPGAELSRLVAAEGDTLAARWLELGLEQIREGVLPVESSVGQLPSEWRLRARTLVATYLPVLEAGALRRVVVVLSDVSERLERERIESEQREVMQLVPKLRSDETGVDGFLRHAGDLVGRLVDDDRLEPKRQRRLLHTLECNTDFFGLKTVADRCRAIQDRLEERIAGMEPPERAALRESWRASEERVRALTGTPVRGVVEVDEESYRRVLDRLSSGEEPARLGAILRSWTLEPVQKRLDLIAAQGRRLAERLGKPGVDILAQGNGVLLDGEVWAPFWSAFVHAVWNAIDHGLEPPEERLARGKPVRGRVILSAAQHGTALALAIEDDGRGIAWERVRSEAEKARLPAHSTHDLAEALFADGLMARHPTSGAVRRGAGMAVLREAVAERAGTIEVESEPGRGTRLVFCFPRVEAMTVTADLEVTHDSTASAPIRVARRHLQALALRDQPPLGILDQG